MKKLFIFLPLCFLLFSCKQTQQTERKELFDFGWKFHRGDLSGAESIDFDDTSWRSIDIPHDYSIEDIPGTHTPFFPDAVSGLNTGFTTGGTAWYRKSFHLPRQWGDKNIQITFEGVYMNTDVWINGQHLGNHPYGYTPFTYDITPYLLPEKENTLAVQVKNEGKNSRWYTGSGIYRHVWITARDLLHMPENGTYITTTQISENQAIINVETLVKNLSEEEQEAELQTTITDAQGNKVATLCTHKEIDPWKSNVFNQTFTIDNPRLWSPETPTLYIANSVLSDNGKEKSYYTTAFGIRKIEINARQGFILNGKSLKLKGGCIHHDNGPLGAKAYDRAEERKAELLKQNGFNAVRVSHNPPSTAFLNACDRIGLMVIDEAFDMWEHGKNPDDYHIYFRQNWKKDINAMIERDRNHPSVIMWSIGNEIPAMNQPDVVENAKMIAEYIRHKEPTRPVTAGINNLDESLNPFHETLDISGYNYAIGQYNNKYPLDIKNHPNRIIYGSESYALDAFDAWKAVLEYPAVIGDFVWTAMDYIGEASIGWEGYPQSDNVYPWTLAYCGDIDICGWKRPQSYYRDAFWSEEPIVSLFVHPPLPSFALPERERIFWSRWHYEDVAAEWNWDGYEGTPFEVDVYSSCDSVELFLNEQSLGFRKTGFDHKCKTTYIVPYAPGTLKAVAHKNGKQITTLLQTTSSVENIKLTADKQTIIADGQDLSYITVELCNNQGLRCTQADDLIEFSISGPGSIVGVGNANPISLESYTAPCRKAWKGRCLVVIKSDRKPGNIILSATVNGMDTKTIGIKSLNYN